MERDGYQTILRNELRKRQERNPAFSLRAFARVLNVSPAHLSKVISGKKPLTVKTAALIADGLGFSPIERTSLIESTIHQLAQPSSTPLHELREEEFRMIADWYHFAILSLSELKWHKSDPRWIAGQLNIGVSEAAEALQRMVRLGIIEIRQGKIQQLTQSMHTSSDIPSVAIRTHHHQNLELARQKLEEIAIEDREFTSMTMAISRKKFIRAKKMMDEFKQNLTSLLESGDRDAVYTLSLQLFPVSKLEKK